MSLTRISKKLEEKRKALEDWREWVARNGGDFKGYLATYRSAKDPGHFGQGAEAIYAADMRYLRHLENQVRRAEEIVGSMASRN